MKDEAPQAAALRAASRALSRELGMTRVSLRPETEGLSNHVFRANTRRGTYIVRLSTDPEKGKVYARERAAIDQVRKVGVPVTEVVAVGQSGQWPYMITRRVPGDTALHHPRRLDVLEELGRLATRIHSVRTVGYGFDYVFPGTGEAKTGWVDWLRDGLHAPDRLRMLVDQGMISRAHGVVLNDTLEHVAGWDELPVLNHGDLRLKNVLVNDAGEIQSIIDWEDAVSSIGPHWDMSVALHDLSIDAKEAFLRGYRLPEAVVRASAPAWRLFNVLNYAPTVDKMEAEGNTEGLEHLKTRLSGALDLYAS